MKYTKEIKIALVSIVTIALFIVGINFLKGRHLFSSEKTYYAIYPNANSLTASSSVMLNGMKVGRVEKLQFVSPKDTRILVKFVISERRLELPKNTVASIVSADILGTRIIDLTLSQDKEMHRDGDTLVGLVAGDMFSEVSSQLAPIKDKFENLAGSIDDLVNNLNMILNEDTQKHLQNGIRDLSLTLNQLKSLAQKTNSVFDQQKENINQILASLTKVSEDISKAELSEVVGKLKSTLEQTDSVMAKINQSEGSLGQLVNDKDLYENLSKSTDSLNKLLEDIQKNPKRYIHFSVFGGKSK